MERGRHAGECRARVGERGGGGHPATAILTLTSCLRRRERAVEDEVLVPELEADGGEHARELRRALRDHVGAAGRRRGALERGRVVGGDLSPTAKTRALSPARPLTDSSFVLLLPTSAPSESTTTSGATWLRSR